MYSPVGPGSARVGVDTALLSEEVHEERATAAAAVTDRGGGITAVAAPVGALAELHRDTAGSDLWDGHEHGEAGDKSGRVEEHGEENEWRRNERVEVFGRSIERVVVFRSRQQERWSRGLGE